jgi:hypothetical protein
LAGKKMVNGIPMADMWRGLSYDRWIKFSEMVERAIDQSIDSIGPELWYTLSQEEMEQEINSHLFKMTERAARKAEWNMNRKVGK